MKAEAGGYVNWKKERAEMGFRMQFRPKAMNVMPKA